MNRLQEARWRERILPVGEQPAITARPAFPRRINLLRQAGVRSLLTSRWPQLLVRALMLAGFGFTIFAGLFGSRVGSHNFSIIFVWIAWWTALKLAFIPLGGRSWCSVCPIPLPGEWLQQGGIFEKSDRKRGLSLRWPKRLIGSWLQAGIFLLIGLFSAATLTDPRLTAWILIGLFVAATGLSLVFERRAFCSYLCPIGGFSGIYAKTAPLEVRVIDQAACRTHREKTCYQNCPWGLYPLTLRDSSPCGLCMECLRACPKDNIAVHLRPFGTDLARPRQSRRLDEAFFALVMLGSALTFSAVFVGPWGSLKSAAYEIGSPAWMLYGLGFLALNLGLLPGCFGIAVWAGQKLSGSKTPLRLAVASQAQALLPLGLFAWIAFTISFAFPKLNYVLAVLSDPMGWGWNLLGTADIHWSPDVTRLGPALQLCLLVGGVFWSSRVARQAAEMDNPQAFRQAAPVLLFCYLFTLAMVGLLIG